MFSNVACSLADLVGEDYAESVVDCAVHLYGADPEQARHLAYDPVEFYSRQRQDQIEGLLAKTGQPLSRPLSAAHDGAPTRAFRKASNLKAAPIGGLGPFRIGEDGRLYLAAKSEHYHTPLGHHFDGYQLIDRARQLGIVNATHNNTRGYITRTMEREIIRCINGLSETDLAGLHTALDSAEPKVLNRVINLETGSLAVEAGVKMMLARFYRLDPTFAAPRYEGKMPVFLVMADHAGGLEANYHGTTVLTQTFRGLWPEFRARAAESGIYEVISVRANDPADFARKIRQYNSGPYKTAGFLHEIILMNYGGLRLDEAYLQEAYRLCREYDTPTLVDEIQSCMWYKGMFLFRLYQLHPDFVILGKGFPGGEYPASKIVTTAEMDCLTQFGALVTNGQEELASLAYLITMKFAEKNADAVQAMGDYFEKRLRMLQTRHGSKISGIEGKGHLAAINFNSVEDAVAFSARMNARCIDVSTQTYKANCPPAALLKLPIILNEKMIDYIIDVMDEIIFGG